MCKFDIVQTRCPELCNDVLKPQSTLLMPQKTSTTNAFSTPSPTTISSSTTPSPTSSSTTASPTYSSTTASPTSSSTTASPTSSSTASVMTTSKSTTPSPIYSSSSTSKILSSSPLTTKALYFDNELIKTNQTLATEQINQKEVKTSVSKAEDTTSGQPTTPQETNRGSTPSPASNSNLTARTTFKPPSQHTENLNDNYSEKQQYSNIVSIPPSKEDDKIDNTPFIVGGVIGGLFIAGILATLPPLYRRNTDNELKTIKIENAETNSQSSENSDDLRINLGDIKIDSLENDTSKYTEKRKRESENDNENDDNNKRRKTKKEDHISNHTKQKRENRVDDTRQFTGDARSFWENRLGDNTNRSTSPGRE